LGFLIGGFIVLFLIFFIIGITSMMEPDSDWGGFGDKIAIVEVTGEILQAEGTVRHLRNYAEDNSVKGIVVRIDSPGGVVGASQEIFSEIARINHEYNKPVVASMASVAASGGYYIACGADCIYANPGTLTGSIGVIIQYPVVKEMLDKIGVQFETVTSGEVKDVGSPFKYPDAADSLILLNAINDTHEQFVETVADKRGLDISEVRKVADGSIFTGRQAQELGLIDSLGGLESAIAYLEQVTGYGTGLKRIRPKNEDNLDLFDIFGKSAAKFINFSEAGSPKLMYLYR
jgi:protease-4